METGAGRETHRSGSAPFEMARAADVASHGQDARPAGDRRVEQHPPPAAADARPSRALHHVSSPYSWRHDHSRRLRWCSGYSWVMPMAPWAWWAARVAVAARLSGEHLGGGDLERGRAPLGGAGGDLGGHRDERGLLGAVHEVLLHGLELAPPACRTAGAGACSSTVRSAHRDRARRPSAPPASSAPRWRSASASIAGRRRRRSSATAPSKTTVSRGSPARFVPGSTVAAAAAIDATTHPSPSASSATIALGPPGPRAPGGAARDTVPPDSASVSPGAPGTTVTGPSGSGSPAADEQPAAEQAGLGQRHRRGVPPAMRTTAAASATCRRSRRRPRRRRPTASRRRPRPPTRRAPSRRARRPAPRRWVHVPANSRFGRVDQQLVGSCDSIASPSPPPSAGSRWCRRGS